MSRESVKLIYQYVVCLVALLILMRGVVDIVSASVSLVTEKTQPATFDIVPPEGGNISGGEIKGVEPSIEDYYQKRMVMDRVGDSLARIIVSGLVFWAFSAKIKSQEA